MNNPIDDAYDAWKEAEAKAAAIELQVSTAWQRHDDERGEPPSRHLLREAAWSRFTASSKLAHAIHLLHEAGLIQPAERSGQRRRKSEGPSFQREHGPHSF
jgi:hypothetical protein